MDTNVLNECNRSTIIITWLQKLCQTAEQLIKQSKRGFQFDSIVNFDGKWILWVYEAMTKSIQVVTDNSTAIRVQCEWSRRQTRRFMVPAENIELQVHFKIITSKSRNFQVQQKPVNFE